MKKSFVSSETEEGFVKLFSKKLGVDVDFEEGLDVLSCPSTENPPAEEVVEDDGSPEVQDIRHVVKVCKFRSIIRILGNA